MLDIYSICIRGLPVKGINVKEFKKKTLLSFFISSVLKTSGVRGIFLAPKGRDLPYLFIFFITFGL